MYIIYYDVTESEAVRSSAGDERASDGNSDGDVTADAPVSGASVSSSPPNETKVRTVSITEHFILM